MYTADMNEIPGETNELMTIVSL